MTIVLLRQKIATKLCIPIQLQDLGALDSKNSFDSALLAWELQKNPTIYVGWGDKRWLDPSQRNSR